MQAQHIRAQNGKFAILIYMDTQTLLKQTSRSLYLSARALPQPVRDAFGTAYLLCRYADSIADTALLPPERRLYWITRYPDMIAHPNQAQPDQLVREISGSSSNPYEEKLLENFPLCLDAFQRLNAAQQAATLEVAQRVCEGMQIDLTTFPAENAHAVKALATEKDLENYCHLMGGAPGIFWSQLIASTVKIGLPAQDFCQLGRNIGDALQIVNILRDLPRDLRIGRCYFPITELSAAGLTPADLLQEENAPRFEPIKRKWILWAIEKLSSAYTYMQALPFTQVRHRAAVAWPVLWTADTLYKVFLENNLLDPLHKVKISRQIIYATMLLTPLIIGSNAGFSFCLNRKLSKFQPTKKDL